jgi:hypothetical protein
MPFSTIFHDNYIDANLHMMQLRKKASTAAQR